MEGRTIRSQHRFAMDGSSFVIEAGGTACRTPGHGWSGRTIRRQHRFAMGGRGLVMKPAARPGERPPIGRLPNPAAPQLNEATSDPNAQ
jgi:hypothetical protein